MGFDISLRDRNVLARFRQAVAKNSRGKKKLENSKNPWQKFVESMAKNYFHEITEKS